MADLDYSGIPEFHRKRDLTTEKLDPNKLNRVLESSPAEVSQSDQIFDSVIRLYLKGEALKEALGNMDPAAFIPVSQGAEVVQSLQRAYPTAGNFSVITFGQFKESCEFLASKSSSLDETVLQSFVTLDPKDEQRIYKEEFQDYDHSGDDLISAFLYGGNALAGVMLAGFMQDVYGMAVPRATAPANEPKQWYAIGMPFGVALLIEMGINFVTLVTLFKDSVKLGPEVETTFTTLSNDPTARRKVIEEQGYDYDKLVNNQAFNDHKKIKDYCLSYIERNSSSTTSYDHWIAYLQTLENQQLVKGAVAMAPSFSSRWRDHFSAEPSPKGDQEQILKIENTFLSSEPTVESTVLEGFNQGVKGYLSNLLTMSNESYDAAFDAFSFKMDDRLLCCVLYFLGPLDTSFLKLVANMLRLTMFKVSLSLKDLLINIVESVLANLLSLLANYTSKILNDIVLKVMKALFSVPEIDIEAAIKLCAGIDFIFKIFELSVDVVAEQLSKILKALNQMISLSSTRQLAGASIYTERKIVITLVSLIDSIVAKLDAVKDICKTPDSSSTEQEIDQIAAEAAVDFVSNSLPTLYPLLAMDEQLSRKHFSNTPGLTTRNLGIKIDGSDNHGAHRNVSDRAEVVSDCSNNSSKTKSTIVAERIAKAFRNVS